MDQDKRIIYIHMLLDRGSLVMRWAILDPAAERLSLGS
jgi:hypothetical protein